MGTNISKSERWIYRCNYAVFTIYNIQGGKFNLSVGDNLQVIGTYSSPENAVAALANKQTQNEEWNKFLEDKDVPTRFRDWELE